MNYGNSKKDEKYRRDRHKRYMRSSKVCANGIPLGETTDSGLKTLLEEMGTKTLF